MKRLLLVLLLSGELSAASLTCSQPGIVLDGSSFTADTMTLRFNGVFEERSLSFVADGWRFAFDWTEPVNRFTRDWSDFVFSLDTELGNLTAVFDIPDVGGLGNASWGRLVGDNQIITMFFDQFSVDDSNGTISGSIDMRAGSVPEPPTVLALLFAVGLFALARKRIVKGARWE